MSKLMISLLAAAGIAFAGAANAADSKTMSRGAYKADKDKIEAQYKADKERCGSMSGNAKDVCQAEAKGKEKVAKAELEANYKNTDKARIDARMAKADADYDVAKEKCDDLSGNAKDVCVADAKAQHEKSKAMATEQRKVSEARSDARADSRDAEYKAAKERCDTYAGDAKDRCVADAKARYGK